MGTARPPVTSETTSKCWVPSIVQSMASRTLAVGGQPRVVQQAREALERRLLITQTADQLGLDTGLFVNDCVHKGRNPFELMPMCPREHVRDILGKASSPRVLGCHKPRLSRVRTRGYSLLNECVLTSVHKGRITMGYR